MRTLRAVVQDGKLKLLEPLDLPENTELTVALLGEADDLSPLAIADLARSGGGFEFLEDAREDVYGPSDGEAV